jgi:hypothetical protein
MKSLVRGSCGCGLDWSRIDALPALQSHDLSLREISVISFSLFDRRLRDSTTFNHCLNIKRPLKAIRKHPTEMTPTDLRLYLAKYLDQAAST